MRDHWWFGTSSFKAPAGIIFGLADGESVPDDFSVYTDADGLFLCGTDSDITVGNTDTTDPINYNAVTGGAHYGGEYQGQHILDYGGQGGGAGSSLTPRTSLSPVYGHVHALTGTYTPERNNLKLIKADVDTHIPLNAVLFGVEPNLNQTPYTLFNDNTTAYLGADTVTEIVAETNSFGVGSGGSPHDHLEAAYREADIVDSTSVYTSVASAGSSHSHSLSATVTPALRQALVRAFKIIDVKNVTGLIGMWDGAGVPDGWELIADFDGRFLRFNDAALGEESGDDTVTMSGSTSSNAHSHVFSGALSGTEYSAIYHSGSAAHSHSSAKTESYLPERLYMKFIKYLG